jgi:hypothetical protein
MADQEREGQDFAPERTETPRVPLSVAGGKKRGGRKKVTNADSRPKSAPRASDISPANKSLSKKVPNKPELEDKKDGDVRQGRVDHQTFGIEDKNSIYALLGQIIEVTPDFNKDDGRAVLGALATVRSIAPRDALEGLLTVQMIGVHNLAMKCLGRASLEGQTLDEVDANVNRAVRLLRTFTSQMEALNRHRGKVGQPVVVGNVNVNDGGQAIVGAVSHDGRGKENVSQSEVGWVIRSARQLVEPPNPKKPTDSARSSWGLEPQKR